MTTTTTRRWGLAGALGALALALPAVAPAATLSTSGSLKGTTNDALDLSLWSSDTSDRDEAPDSSNGAAAPDAACPDEPLSDRFAAWSDPASYKLVPGGAFEEGGAGWLLSGGAAVAAGGNAFGTADHALALPGGASATSPLICIAPGSPVARGFAQGAGGGLRVELLDEAGRAKPAGVLAPMDAWDATRRFTLSQGWFLAGNATDVAWMRIRFTADPGSSWRVDDVYADPRSFG